MPGPLPEAPVAVAVHHSPSRELDRTYATLSRGSRRQAIRYALTADILCSGVLHAVHGDRDRTRAICGYLLGAALGFE